MTLLQQVLDVLEGGEVLCEVTAANMLRAAIEAGAVVQQWEPIETAPKDGTHVLICRATDADGKPIGDSLGLFTHRAAWWEGDNEWIVYNSQVLEQPAFFTPTHWQSLPAPPKEKV